MRFFLKRWRTALVAVLAAVAGSVAFAGTASAQEPGEGGSWTHETVNNGENLQTRTTLAEARNANGDTLRVWRGAAPLTDQFGQPAADAVWMSFNGGNAVLVGTTTATTDVAPAVTVWGSRFMIFHTGTDHHIYYTWYDPSINQFSSFGWQQVPGQTTQAPVGVVDTGGQTLHMLYHGDTNNNMYYTTFNGLFGAGTAWNTAVNIGGAEGFDGPVIGYNGRILMAAVRGLDSHLWTARAFFSTVTGRFIWGNFQQQVVETLTRPAVAGNRTTNNFMVNYVDTADVPNYVAIDSNGNAIQSANGGFWSQDITNWMTHNAVTIVAIAAAFYAIFVGLDAQAYFKQVWNGN